MRKKCTNNTKTQTKMYTFATLDVATSFIVLLLDCAFSRPFLDGGSNKSIHFNIVSMMIVVMVQAPIVTAACASDPFLDLCVGFGVMIAVGGGGTVVVEQKWPQHILAILDLAIVGRGALMLVVVSVFVVFHSRRMG